RCRDKIYGQNLFPHLKHKYSKTYIDLMQRKPFKLFARKNPPPYLGTPQKGSLAQLVQSICLTSRGSAVRSRQLPQNKRPVIRPFSFSYFLHFALRAEEVFVLTFNSENTDVSGGSVPIRRDQPSHSIQARVQEIDALGSWRSF